MIEEGEAGPGDRIEQVGQASHDWTVERVFRLLIGGGYRGEGAKDDLKALAELETLAETWRGRAAKLGG